MKPIYLSLVIPVYNEEECLEVLFKRLHTVLEEIGKPYEIIFTNDGSKDRSSEILKSLYEKHPDIVRVIEFNANYGQHMAIMAAFEIVRGEVIINIDADMQNPPEEIPALLKTYEAGHDMVGSFRIKRHDNVFRTWGSRLVNYIRGKVTNVYMKDHGCMLRAYSREIVDKIVESEEHSTFITILGYKFAKNPTEIGVKHVERELGTSEYGVYRLARVTFDMMTSFSLIPIQVFTFFGMSISALSFLLVIYLMCRRLILGPEAEGLFTLFAILFFLVSVAITGIGIIGEYIGRIYQKVSNYPRYIIREILENSPSSQALTTEKKALKSKMPPKDKKGIK